jgi:outer membrane protein TolC
MSGRAWVIAAWCLLGPCVSAGAQTAAAGVQQSTPPAAAQEFERTVPYEQRVAAAGPVIRLTAREAVDFAMRNNLDIAIERYGQQLALRRVEGARGFYDTSLSVSAGVSSTSNPLTPQAGSTTIPFDEVDVTTFAPGLRQNIAGGGSVAVGLSSVKTATSSASASVNPLIGSSLSLALTQPLARGFLATSADRQIDLARLDVDIAASQFRQKVTAVVQQVLGQYWELQYALSVYEARRQAKDLALMQYEGARLRVQSGLLPPVAVTSAQAEIASRERDLLQAEVQIIGAENGLKFLIAADPSSPLWRTAVIAVDTPRPDETAIDVSAAVDLATARRPELEQLRLQTAQNAADRRFYQREKLPTVNLTASLTSVGRTGTVIGRDGALRVADPTNPIAGGYGRGWSQVFGFDFPGWGLGVNVQLPLRNRTAEALLDQATLARSRLDTQATKTLQAVIVDVRNTAQVIATQRKSLEAARLTTQLFKEQLEAQTARYDANFSNDFELRRYQRDLVDARVRELRALVDLQLATIALRRATDTLLDEYGAPPSLAPRPSGPPPAR